MINKVGANWKNKYHEGEGFAIQPAHFYKGSQLAPGYSYQFCGGDSQYSNIPIETLLTDNLLHYDSDTYFYGSLSEPMPARLGAGITASEMHAERVDGWNPLAVIDAYKRKMALIKNNEGPVLLDVVTYRLVGHSTSDQNAYRSKEEIEDWRSHDPIVKFRAALVEAGVESDEFFGKLLQDTADRM